jgi:signal transduction histidine kinase/HAMP domain-containing protein
MNAAWLRIGSLQAKLLVGTMLVLIPVLALLLVAFNASYDRRQEIVLESLLQTARGAASLVDATFDEAITLGQAVAGDPAIRSLDPGRMAPRLQRLGSGYDQYESFFVFDTAGALIADSEVAEAMSLNIADRPYFQHVIRTGTPTSFELILGRRTGDVSTGVAVPIVGEASTTVGVLVIAFDLDRLQDRIATMGLYGSQAVVLFDPGGRLALQASEHPVAIDRPWEERDFSGLPDIRSALGGEAVVSTNSMRTVDGRPLAMAVVRSRLYGWAAAATWPAGEAFAPANEARQRELLAFVGIAVTSVLGTAMLANSVTRPVRRLAHGALAFGRGDLDHRLDIRTGDELGQLGQSFNTMAGQIQATLSELQAARQAAEAGWHEAEVARAAAELGERRATFLAEAGAALSESLDYAATLQRVANLAVPTVADWCVVDIVEREGTVSRVAAAHADTSKASIISELQRRYMPQPTWRDHPVATVLRDGTPMILTNLDAAGLREIARDAEHFRLLHSLGTQCLMVVPFWARGRILGTIALATGDSGHCYDDGDLALVESLASRAAVAVDNARLHTETERAVRVRDEFLASASHELRTPISHVKGFVSSLRQTDVEWDEDVRQDFLAEIERETDRLARLIGDLLDMTRLESGGLDDVDRAPVRSRDFINGGLDRVRGFVRGHTVQVDVAADLPPVLGEISQLERLVANLAENAAKFSPPGTTIRISAATVGSTLELRVEDEGAGIPPDQLELIFEKFHRVRVDGETTPGTGLGLSICRRIVEAHGGTIRAENYGRGARVIVELPLAARTVAVRHERGPGSATPPGLFPQ